MPPTLLPEVLLRGEDAGQTELALAAEGVLRVVWDGRFGTMLIEVVGGQVFVNGQQVLPVEPRCSCGTREAMRSSATPCGCPEASVSAKAGRVEGALGSKARCLWPSR
jgi:hypothetical protein